ncbi:hypothetical protein SRHO_G00050530 [Serrasalmus rhombeus]
MQPGIFHPVPYESIISGRSASWVIAVISGICRDGPAEQAGRLQNASENRQTSISAGLNVTDSRKQAPETATSASITHTAVLRRVSFCTLLGLISQLTAVTAVKQITISAIHWLLSRPIKFLHSASIPPPSLGPPFLWATSTTG